ncbi:hypothetical protein Chor_002011 [Crotalus horridus]
MVLYLIFTPYRSTSAPSWLLASWGPNSSFLKSAAFSRYTTVSLLAEDILQLSRRRSDILLGYLGVETIPEVNGILGNDSVSFDSVN